MLSLKTHIKRVNGLSAKRLPKYSIAIQVERGVSEVASRYLGILYGSLEPTEIEAALNIKSKGKAAPVEMDFDEVVG